MLKKYARRVLLPLLFSFCCVFSGFLSVNTFAYTGFEYYDLTRSNLTARINTTEYSANFVSSDNHYTVQNSNTISNVTQFNFGTLDTPWVVPVDVNAFDYYLVNTVTGSASNISNFTFFPDSVVVYSMKHNNEPAPIPVSNVNIYHTDSNRVRGYSISCKLDLSVYSNIVGVVHRSSSAGTVPAYLMFEARIISLPKDSSAEAVQNAIVTAINNQTSSLGGKLDGIDSSVDDVQQSIEDQYSGEPEEEFNIDDVMTEHTEKMGVLSFGSDVMVQFLDMFQSANAGTAELTLPGFNITVQNVEYQVWPDYSFNFNQIDTWVPGLMSIIRVILPAFVWLKVLGYCITVFEKNFLSNNGG